MILLMFDANKVDISDEFKSVIQSLEGYDDKVCGRARAAAAGRSEWWTVGAGRWAVRAVPARAEQGGGLYRW
jgi:hypothetical protein